MRLDGGEAEQLGFPDEDAEETGTARQGANGGTLCFRHADSDEVFELCSVWREDAQCTVARSGQLNSEIDDSLQQRRQRKLGRERKARVQQPFCPAPDHVHARRS